MHFISSKIILPVKVFDCHCSFCPPTFSGRLAVSLYSHPQASTPLIILGWLLIFFFFFGVEVWGAGGGIASFLSPLFSSAQQPFPIHNSWHGILALAARDHTPNHLNFFLQRSICFIHVVDLAAPLS